MKIVLLYVFTLSMLRSNKGLDECVSGLGIEGQCMSQ